MMITTVIFDWGGVLIKNPSPGIFAYCARILGVPTDAFGIACQKYESELQKGAISEKTFWTSVCADLHVPLPKQKSLWNAAFQDAYEEQPKVTAIVKQLRKNHYTTAMLSNTEKSSLSIFQEHQGSLFDVCVFSCDEGVSKPDPKIYKLTLQRLQIQPAQALFIDDRKQNITAAQHLGMNAVVFTTPEQLKKDLCSYSIRI
jgi:putative hydrolase of the HAD superfamily